jgi:hypothetical protein
LYSALPEELFTELLDSDQRNSSGTVGLAARVAQINNQLFRICFTAGDLVQLVQDLQRDCFHQYISDTLLRRAFVSEVLDISGAQTAAADFPGRVGKTVPQLFHLLGGEAFALNRTKENVYSKYRRFA